MSVKYLLAIDVEASGSNIDEHFIPAFGACVVSVDDKCVMEEFLSYLDQPYGTDWEERCLHEFWESETYQKDGKNQLEQLVSAIEEHGTEACGDAMDRFIDWARHVKSKYGDDIIVVTDTSAFDTTWINVYLSRYADPVKKCASLVYLFGSYMPVRDVSSFYHGVVHCLQVWGGAKEALAKLSQTQSKSSSDPWPEWVTSVEADHNPLNDAKRIGLQAAHIVRLLEDMKEQAKKEKIVEYHYYT